MFTERVFNFSAGPAALPEPVLRQAASEMLNWRGSGMSVMEMSHRGADFMGIAAKAMADLKTLLNVPESHEVLFMQGGGLAQNAIVPLNLLPEGGAADAVVSGGWSKKSYLEAQKYGAMNLAASNETASEQHAAHCYWPETNSWRVNTKAAYLHLCTNETIGGIEVFDVPALRRELDSFGAQAVPIVADVSSHILSRPMNVADYGVMFGGAQKNIGPAGLTIVIIRKDLLGRAQKVCPSAFDFSTVAKNESMYNTPPTYAIYIAGLVFEWLLAQGGLAVMAQRNAAKAQLLYAALDNSSLFYSRVAKNCRSQMNVPFYMRDESLYTAFLDGAKAQGLLQLKGHKSVGGLRASIYNAMPIEGVQALVNYLAAFEKAA